ncbi:MAG: energy transducer TonB [Ignavibacteriales bacterium]|nr:MAG: energy transducer TonB [Ignavibacteriales bacterium]
MTHRVVEEEDEYVFFWSEELPEPIGGMVELQKKVHYTEFARKVGIEGRVIIEAVIGKDGIVKEAKVAVGLIEDLDQISLEAVRTTLFKPGLQRGKPVNVRINIPIAFKLR